MKTHVHKDGFTLVELTMAIVTTALLALTVGAMLVYTSRGLQRQRRMEAYQANLRVSLPALYRMARECRSTDVTTPAPGATGPEFAVGTNRLFRANGWTAVAGGTNLVYTGDRGNIMLSPGWVRTFSVTRGTNRIDFVLEIGDAVDSICCTNCAAYFRNPTQ